VAVELFERRADPSCRQSRAVTIQRDILSLCRRFGLIDEILRDGTSWSLGRTYRGDREILQTKYASAGPEVHPAFVNYPQYKLEELLYYKAVETPGVTLHYDSTVTDVAQDESGVTAVASSADGSADYEGEYLIAADGIGSRIRRGLDVAFEGWSTDGRFAVADFRADLPYARERRLWFNPPFYPDGIVLMHAIAHDQWRLDWQIDPSADDEAFLQPAAVVRRVRDAIGDDSIDVEVLRANTYSFQQLRAAQFRVGRIFLVGDAAHVVSPFGARGMNSGMEDADNLAWKIAWVTQGRATDSLLETYALEREAAADEHLSVTGATMRFMVPTTDADRQRRDSVLAEAEVDPSSGPAVDSGKLYVPVPYVDSPLTIAAWDAPPTASTDSAPAVGSLEPGHPAIDGYVIHRGERTTLRGFLANQLTLLAVPGSRSNSSAADLQAQLRNSAPLPGVRRAILGRSVSPAAPVRSEVDELIDDHSGELWRAYAGPTDRVFLIRPDAYVAARAEASDADRLVQAVAMRYGMPADGAAS
jgi:2-polyprenyl-6-methoxyphenol hydroxylase-like FAD-dependent oxidoreductase